MLITPEKMVNSKYVFCKTLSLEENQFQQVGLDVRVGKIMGIHGTATLTQTEKILPTYNNIDTNQDDCWVLQPGAYALECCESCKIPVGYEGRLIHRSTFNRSGCFITGSVYDPGYEGIIAGTMYVFIPLIVQRYTRVAQFQMRTAEAGSSYDGDYQKQESHTEAAEKLDGKNKTEI